MRRIRIVGLCLVAAFALSAVVAGAASAALPEFLSVNKTTKKEETNTAKISIKSVGKESKLEGGVVIECKSDTSKGDILGAKSTVKLKVTYSGCTAPSITSSCQTKSTKPGTITTESLKGELKYATEESGEKTLTVVNDLEPEKAGKPFAKFTCGPKAELNVIVTGKNGILAEQGPVNAGLSKTGFTINREKAKEKTFGCTHQQFLYINGTGPCEHLETGAGASWNVSEDVVTAKSEIEIKG